MFSIVFFTNLKFIIWNVTISSIYPHLMCNMFVIYELIMTKSYIIL